ncbi:MAG: hypothetical protein KAI08_18325 [Bacteroidales bacterium]|nr:hypothetical protein [Bacteroidales bacterium]
MPPSTVLYEAEGGRLLAVLLIAIGLFAGCDNSTQEEIVQIPDGAFLYVLIVEGVDKNGDGQISYPEAEATEALLIPPEGITVLQGFSPNINYITTCNW